MHKLKNSKRIPIPANREAFRCVHYGQSSRTIMLRRLAKLIGLGGKPRAPARAVDHPAPFADAHANSIYNLLFCDDPALFKDRNGRERFDAGADPAKVCKIAEDQNQESRVRALAYNWLRARNETVPAGIWLGVIAEVPVDDGTDVLAAYADGRVRYINHTGAMSFFEGAPPEIAAGAKAVVDSAAAAGGLFKPLPGARTAPAGDLRFTVLTANGLQVVQGSWQDIGSDPKLDQILNNAIRLLQLVVGTTVEKN
jgi:hypothetical protein